MTMFHLQVMLFLLVIVGVIASRLKIISLEARKSMSEILIDVILPCNIIDSFQIEFTSNLMVKSVEIIMISFGVQLIYIVVSYLFYTRVPHDKQMVLRYGTICSNVGFIGLPVIGAVYGAIGLYYASLALIPIRVVMWSAGLSLYTKTDGKTIFKTLITHPCIIAVLIGFVVMFSPYEMPVFLKSTISTIGRCTTTVSMLVIGAMLSEISIKSMVNKLILYYSFIRLLVLPFLVFIILKLLCIDSLLIGITVLMTAMPAGSMTAILAAKYNCDAEFASKCVFVTTLFSVVTIQLVSLVL